MAGCTLEGMENFTVSGEVEIFPGEAGWHFVRVPTDISDEVRHLANRGLVPITAAVREYTWETSLMPMGDGSPLRGPQQAGQGSSQY